MARYTDGDGLDLTTIERNAWQAGEILLAQLAARAQDAEELAEVELLALVGAYASTLQMFTVGLTLVFGVIGYRVFNTGGSTPPEAPALEAVTPSKPGPKPKEPDEKEAKKQGLTAAEVEANYVKVTPIRRVLQTEEMGWIIAFLASPRSGSPRASASTTARSSSRSWCRRTRASAGTSRSASP